MVVPFASIRVSGGFSVVVIVIVVIATKRGIFTHSSYTELVVRMVFAKQLKRCPCTELCFVRGQKRLERKGIGHDGIGIDVPRAVGVSHHVASGDKRGCLF